MFLITIEDDINFSSPAMSSFAVTILTKIIS